MPKIDPHFLDPLTIEHRRKQYRNGYTRQVIKMQNLNHLNLLTLIQRVPKGLKIIEKRYAGKLTPSEILLRQAMLVNRMAGKMADAYIDGVKGGIDKFEVKDFKEKANEFADTAGKILGILLTSMYSKESIMERKGLLKYITKTNNYLALPENLHKRRRLHYKRIIEIVNKASKQEFPENGFLSQVDNILRKKKTGQTLKVKALDICTAASIFADIMERKGHSNWNQSYRYAMELAYTERLKNHEDLLEAIVDLK